jgi:phenylalanyl-tRNA synthetase beta chain
MKYSYNWLKELSGTKKDAQKVVDELTMKSFEVEGLEKIGGNLDGVVVGRILEIKKHPNADKLRIVRVDVGKEMEVVCGAPNIEVGQKVAVALLGTKLPNGMEMKEVEIRCVKSSGMICAEDELGLGEDHSGILVLDPKSKIGMPLVKAMEIEDYVLEMKILPDRSHDAQSHVGVAREIAVLEGRKFDYDFEGLKLPKVKSKKLAVEIKDKNLCSRYIGAVVENIQIKESPQWMKNRLQASGIRAINNVVDATNYVMLEIGQPLHAFDRDKMESDIILVRRANEGEEINLLDKGIQKLSNEDLLITDGKRPAALAGIKGARIAEIDDNTKNIVLEAASFNATNIRKTRTRLGIQTESSQRFEKDIDPNLTEKAMVRLIEIIEHIAGGKLEGVCDVYPQKVSAWKIKLDLEYANKLLGEKVAPNKVIEILQSLDMAVSKKGKFVEAKIPTFRLDLKTQEDLIEEIGRVYGYEKIKPEAPLVPISPAPVNEQRIFTRSLKNILAALGFSEVYNYSFYSQRDAGLAQLGSIKHLELANPINPDQALARISLIPNILKNIRENLKNFREFHIFEIGHVYWPNSTVLPEEKEMLVGAIVLEKKSAQEEKQDKRHQSSFFEIKSAIDGMMAQIGITDHYYDNFNGSPIETPKSLWHESRSAEIKIEGSEETVGFAGEINPFVLAQFDIHTRVVMFEFDMQKLFSISEGEREYVPIRKQPVVTRDISLVVDGNVRVDDILKIMQKAGGDMVLDVDLFDAIDFADNTSSFAFHITLGTDEKTLTGKEIDDTMHKITTELEKEQGMKVRR